MTDQPEISREGSTVKVVISLPEDTSYEEIDVHLEGCSVLEACLGNKLDLMRVILPCEVEPEECKVRLSKKKSQLSVTLVAKNDENVATNVGIESPSPSLPLGINETSFIQAQVESLSPSTGPENLVNSSIQHVASPSESVQVQPALLDSKERQANSDLVRPLHTDTLSDTAEPHKRENLDSTSSTKTSQKDKKLVRTLVKKEPAGPLITASDLSNFHVCLVPPRVTSLGALRTSTKGKKGKKGEGSKWGDLARPAAASLLKQGFAVVDNFAGLDTINKVRQEIVQLETQYENGEIWVGKEASVGAQLAVGSVRGDKVLWVDKEALRCGPFSALRELMKSIDRFTVRDVGALVPKLARVTERSDPMLAIYPGGGSRFQKHIDNTAEDGRVLTVLCYLNPAWEARMGGQLRLHPDVNGHTETNEGSERVPVDVCPAAGRLAMFWSDSVPHEVMPAQATRHSVTMWFYDTKERDRAIEKGQVTDMHSHSPHVFKGENDMQAKLFMKEMLTQNVDPAALYHKAQLLNPAALSIVATINGAEDSDEFLEGLSRIDSDRLAELRSSLIDMGIE